MQRFCVLVFFLFICAVSATNYYVSNSGNDNNAGTSTTAPIKTLTRATVLAKAGDTVNLDRNSTFNEEAFWVHNGTASARITIQPYGSGTSKPTIKNTAGDQWCGICLEGSYYTFTGLYVTNVLQYGALIREMSTNNIITGIEFTAVGYAVSALGNYNLITHNYMHDLLMIKNTPGGDDDYGATAVGLTGTFNEVSYNTMIRCQAPSDDYITDGGCLELWEGASNSYFHHNWCQDSDDYWEAGASFAITIYNTTISENIFINSQSGGWHFDGKFAADYSNFQIVNNAFYETKVGEDQDTMFYGIDGAPDPSQLIFKNNIMYSTVHSAIADASDFVHQYNIYYFTLPGAQLLPLGTGEKNADPRWVNAPTTFHISQTSPALATGVAVSFPWNYVKLDYYQLPLPTPPSIGPAQWTVTYNYLYNDALASNYRSVSWNANINLTATPAYSGTEAIKVQLLGSGGFGLRITGGMPVAGMYTLEFCVRAVTGTVKLAAYMQDVNYVALTSIPIDLSLYAPTIGTSYVKLIIPLSVFNAVSIVPSTLIIQSYSYGQPSSFYLDQIRLASA